MELSAEELIGGLAELRQDGILCDITLQTEGKNISAHRSLLAAASLYFRAMFGGNFKEAKEDIINLDALGVSTVGLSTIVDCLYSLKLNITKDNFVAITEAANLLQFTFIVTLCEKFMESHLDVCNCFQILQISETYGMKLVENVVDSFLLENLLAVSEQNPDFVGMSKELLVRYIADTELFTNDEVEVYRTVMKWIKSSPSRDEHTAELMQYIRMHHIPLDVITNELAKEPLLQCNVECTKQVKEAIDYHNFPYKQPLFKSFPPRGEQAMMVLETSMENGEREWYFKAFPSCGKSSAPISQDCLSSTSHPNRSDFTGVSIGNFSYFHRPSNSGNSLIPYDPITDKWLELASLPYRQFYCTHFIYAAFKDSLILGGGLERMSDPDLILSTCFLYSVEHNTWKQIVDLPEQMMGPLFTVHENNLYVTSYYTEDENGGIDDMKKLWMFDPTTNIWQEKATALHKHPDGIFAGVQDKLLLAGGLDSDNPSGYKDTAEIYDIKSDQWTNILNTHPNLDIPLLCRIAEGNTFVDDKSGNIYFFGSRDTGNREDPKFEALAVNPISGFVSTDCTWLCSTTLQELALGTVPKGRFQRTTK